MKPLPITKTATIGLFILSLSLTGCAGLSSSLYEYWNTPRRSYASGSYSAPPAPVYPSAPAPREKLPQKSTPDHTPGANPSSGKKATPSPPNAPPSKPESSPKNMGDRKPEPAKKPVEETSAKPAPVSKPEREPAPPQPPVTEKPNARKFKTK